MDMMDKLTLQQKAKEQIAEGNTENALELVTAFLAQKTEYKLLYTESLHLAALLNKTKLDQSKRISTVGLPLSPIFFSFLPQAKPGQAVSIRKAVMPNTSVSEMTG